LNKEKSKEKRKEKRKETHHGAGVDSPCFWIHLTGGRMSPAPRVPW